MSQDDIIARLSVKSSEYIFLHELENGFELSPKEARGILESAKTVFDLEEVSQPGSFRPGNCPCPGGIPRKTSKPARKGRGNPYLKCWRGGS